MNKRNMLIGLLTGALFITGCGANDNQMIKVKNTSTTGEGSTTATTTKQDYITIGEIIEIKDSIITILTGDIAQDYKVSKESVQLLYLGETVSVTEEADGNYSIQSYLIDDFSVRFTGMGLRIETLMGKVTKIETLDGESTITVVINEEEKTLTYYGETLPVVDTTYELELTAFTPTDNTLLNFYNPESIIQVTITSLSRAENGELTFLATDKDGGEYSVGTSSKTLNFNLSELAIGDVLDIYADAVMESWPMQVQSSKINKVVE
jgi:hypothetical protein